LVTLSAILNDKAGVPFGKAGQRKKMAETAVHLAALGILPYHYQSGSGP
jgi:hypothetical protein